MQRFIKKRLSTMGLCFKGNTYHFDNIPKKLYFTSVDIKSIRNPSSTHEDSKYVNMFRQILVATLCLAGVSAMAGEVPDKKANSILFKNKPPNVLFISIDDLNDWVGAMGTKADIKTPNIDKLASDGMLFTNAHCQLPVCGPSRTSIFSGYRPDTLGIYNNDSRTEDGNVQKMAKKMDNRLLHEYFRDNGYKTMAVGKLMHKHIAKGSVDQSGGRKPGFGPSPKKRNFKAKGTSTDWNAYPETDAQMPDTKTAQWAADKLKEKHDKPFLLMVGFLRPHVPWNVPQKWWDLYDPEKITLAPYKKDDLDDVPKISKDSNILSFMPQTEWAIKNNKLRQITQAYMASISFVDNCVGTVLDSLESSEYKDNTIIILWSDHGYHIGEKGTFQKHSLWQRATRVPLIISKPGMSAGKNQKPVELLDIYPTLLDLCGLPANKKNEGKSLKPLLENTEAAWDKVAITTYRKQEKHCLATKTPYIKDPSHGIYDERYHYIVYSDGSEELYDLQNDPNEWHNIASNPELNNIKNRLKASFSKQMSVSHQ